MGRSYWMWLPDIPPAGARSHHGTMRCGGLTSAWLSHETARAGKPGHMGENMLDQLRGRNLAHVGCTIGLTLGLIIGMLAAFVVVLLNHAAQAAGYATIVFFGITFILGAVGYVLGSRATSRVWGPKSSDD